MSSGQAGFSIPQSLSHHEYTHRMMKVLSTVHMLDVKEGYPKDEFLIRSCMMSNILVADMHEKLVIEAGTLSYIPQYCDIEGKKKLSSMKKFISDNFGANRAKLIMEVEELRVDFIEEYEVSGYSIHAKNIYGVHVYLDLVNMLNPNPEVKIIDGEIYQPVAAKKKLIDEYSDEDGKTIKLEIPKGELYIDYGGDPMHLGRYYQFMVEVAKYKIGELKFVNTNIQQAIAELCLQISKQQGIIIK